MFEPQLCALPISMCAKKKCAQGSRKCQILVGAGGDGCCRRSRVRMPSRLGMRPNGARGERLNEESLRESAWASAARVACRCCRCFWLSAWLGGDAVMRAQGAAGGKGEIVGAPQGASCSSVPEGRCEPCASEVDGSVACRWLQDRAERVETICGTDGSATPSSVATASRTRRAVDLPLPRGPTDGSVGTRDCSPESIPGGEGEASSSEGAPSSRPVASG